MRKTAITVLFLFIAATTTLAGGNAPAFEIGGFYQDLSDGQDDWHGERLMLTFPSGNSFIVQLEMENQERGDQDAQIAGVGITFDVNRFFSVFTGLSLGSGADFFPEHRMDVELTLKVPGHERLSFFGGGGRARFQDAELDMMTVGVAREFDHWSLRYRHVFFDQDPLVPLTFEGSGNSDSLVFGIGTERGGPGQFELTMTRADDFLREFSFSGKDAPGQTNMASLAWRRMWTEHFGTHVQADWGEIENTFERAGGEVRLFWK